MQGDGLTWAMTAESIDEALRKGVGPRAEQLLRVLAEHDQWTWQEHRQAESLLRWLVAAVSVLLDLRSDAVAVIGEYSEGLAPNDLLGAVRWAESEDARLRMRLSEFGAGRGSDTKGLAARNSQPTIEFTDIEHEAECIRTVFRKVDPLDEEVQRASEALGFFIYKARKGIA